MPQAGDPTNAILNPELISPPDYRRPQKTWYANRSLTSERRNARAEVLESGNRPVRSVKMKHAGTQFLFSYWDHLRAGRAAPDRRDIDLAAIRPVLADTFLLEVDDAREFNLCLAGDRVSELFQRELKGKSFLDQWSPEDRPAIRRTLDSVVEGVVPALMGVSAAPAGRSLLPLELVFLPMRNFGKTHSRVLGAITPSATPSWLGLLPIGELHLTSMRLLIRSPVSQIVLKHPDRRAPQVTHVGHLRVLEGGKSNKDTVIL